MVAYSFSSEFAWLVEAGVKRQTVRQVRRRQTVVGDTFQAYTGAYVGKRPLVYRSNITAVTPLEIDARGMLRRGAVCLRFSERVEFAKRDGFVGLGAFLDFFRGGYGLPFAGEVVGWSVPRIDETVYGVINFMKGDGFVNDWLAAGHAVWEAPNGFLFGIAPWDVPGGVWARKFPAEWIMTGCPEAWEVYCG